MLLFDTDAEIILLMTFSRLLQGTPAVMETYVDSKKEVDSHLKRTCEDFIHSITQMFVGSLTDFLTKVHLTSLYTLSHLYMCIYR